MTLNLPSDSDGDALRRLWQSGSDLTRPMTIDFAMSVPNEQAGAAFAAAATRLGYQADLDKDEPSGEWICYCSRRMVPSHTAILDAQRELNIAGRPFGAEADGWGSFGNAGE
ncbi:MAG: ribonuclease E inhibitor RraB [Phycisphaeraceae bacterium]|nr:ribonuclease E inhibitor RraB [Phycisphaeraceae bacterium]